MMSDYTTLPLEAHGDNRSVFLEHAWNIGRAYRNQALELISICLLLSQITPPKLAYEDAELRRKLRVCDLALRSAADSGTKVTGEANARFEEATRVLSSHSCVEGGHRLDLPSIYSRMEIAREKDCIEKDWLHVKSEDKWVSTMTVNFVSLQSPLLSIHTRHTTIVSQELSADPSFPEIIWNFSRYKGHARITLEQNPHFYLHFPTNVSTYTPRFQGRPLQDPSRALAHNGTVYVLFDRPGRVFLTTEHKLRIFGNVWSMNGSLIFRDRAGVLEGDQLVRGSGIWYNLSRYETLAVHRDSKFRLNRSYLQPIATTLSANHSADWKSKDWIVLTHPAFHCVDVQIHSSRGSTSGQDLALSPPISERPGYDVLYATINGLNDDILLDIFNYYHQLYEENAWNLRLGWRNLSHTCRRWRHLVYSSAFHRHPASHCIDTHIYGSRGSTSGLVCSSASSYSDIPRRQDPTPPPPTSEQPGYNVLYATVNGLNDDILLDIFNYYRLDEENAWNVRLGWRKLSHACRRWRHLVYSSAFHLGMHIHCTNGTPIVHTLDHLPPLPLFVNYRYIRGQDELGIYHALRSRDRVRLIDLHLPPSILHKSLVFMDRPFSILDHLSLSFTIDKTTTLTLPKTFQAPNLRHLSLFGIKLPKRLRFLSSTVSLVTLVLRNIQTPGYFRPRLLVARLQSLPQLEELSISFSIPIPRPSVERELLGKRGTPVTLPNLKNLRFQGVSAYLECLVAQIKAPLLERLSITLFNQIVFELPYLSHFTNIIEGKIEGLKFSVAEVSFGHDAVSIITDDNTPGYNGRFSLHVMSKQLDWQIDCAAQICNALRPALSGVEKLTLKFYDRTMPTEWQNGEIDSTTWHELLMAFISVKELHISAALSQELSRALQVDEAGSDPGLLPGLQELVSEFKWERTDNPFGSFIDARRVAGRPVHSSFPLSRRPESPPIRPTPQIWQPRRPHRPILFVTNPSPDSDSSD